MWRLIKKWWLLREFEKAIARHTEKESVESLSVGNKVLITQAFFIHGSENYPGIAYKSANRFSWLLRWRKNNESRLKRKVRQYSSLFESCVRDGYIELQPTSHQPMPALTHKADDIHGVFGLIQLLGNKFTVPWGIIGAIVTFLIGLKWKEILEYIF